MSELEGTSLGETEAQAEEVTCRGRGPHSQAGSKVGAAAQMCVTVLHLVIFYFSEATRLSFSKLLHFQASCPRRVSCFTSKAISSP